MTPASPTSGAQTQERSLWRPIRDGNAFESTVQRLAQAIKLGAVSHGERLPPERELADKLQVSRGTLREAIKALRLAGFLASRPGRNGGNFVTYRATAVSELGAPESVPGYEPGSAEAVRDLVALREVLEPGAAALAARLPLVASDRAHLTSCLEAARDRDPDIRRVNDSRLHLAIVAATGSPSLTSAVMDVQLQLDLYLARLPLLERNLEHSDHHHEAIVEAILAGDAEKARFSMEEHCRATAMLLEGLLA
jgi:DNA-binding FadR family transcriptional regulator